MLQLRNNYEKEVFMEMGVITKISSEDQTLTVRLDDDRKVPYEFSELDELTLAYAISLHKAQGSEYPVCVIPLAMEQYLLLERKSVYTGVTRARQLVMIAGSKKALSIAVRNGPKPDLQEGASSWVGTVSSPQRASQARHRMESYTGLAIRRRMLQS